MYGIVDEKTGQRMIPATFRIINFIGWKFDKSQPKPLKRGSASSSLKNINSMTEEQMKAQFQTKFTPENNK